MNILDEMLSSYLAQDYKHELPSMQSKLTDPVSIYMGVGPNVQRRFTPTTSLPLVWITVDVNSDSDFEYEAGLSMWTSSLVVCPGQNRSFTNCNPTRKHRLDNENKDRLDGSFQVPSWMK